MQDPTAICKSTVHHKVMLDNEIGHKVAIESVLILKNVIFYHLLMEVIF